MCLKVLPVCKNSSLSYITCESCNKSSLSYIAGENHSVSHWMSMAPHQVRGRTEASGKRTRAAVILQDTAWTILAHVGHKLLTRTGKAEAGMHKPYPIVQLQGSLWNSMDSWLCSALCSPPHRPAAWRRTHPRSPPSRWRQWRPVLLLPVPRAR